MANQLFDEPIPIRDSDTPTGSNGLSSRPDNIKSPDMDPSLISTEPSSPILEERPRSSSEESTQYVEIGGPSTRPRADAVALSDFYKSKRSTGRMQQIEAENERKYQESKQYTKEKNQSAKNLNTASLVTIIISFIISLILLVIIIFVTESDDSTNKILAWISLVLLILGSGTYIYTHIRLYSTVKLFAKK